MRLDILLCPNYLLIMLTFQISCILRFNFCTLLRELAFKFLCTIIWVCVTYLCSQTHQENIKLPATLLMVCFSVHSVAQTRSSIRSMHTYIYSAMLEQNTVYDAYCDYVPAAEEVPCGSCNYWCVQLPIITTVESWIFKSIMMSAH